MEEHSGVDEPSVSDLLNDSDDTDRRQHEVNSAIGIEEHPVVDRSSLSDLSDDSDETYLHLEDTLEAQFDAAVKVIQTRHQSFNDPETLYEFLFKFRDVLEYSSPVSGTLLHFIANMMPEDEPQAGVDALARRLIQEHPQMLCKSNSKGLTPVSTAVVSKQRQFVRTILRTCSDDATCRQALEEALKIPDSDGKTILHHSSRFPSRFRVSLKRFMAFATNEALGIQDGSGRTPLHYVVSSDSWRPSLLDIVGYFLARDTVAQESGRNREYFSDPAHTFLDVIDSSGHSVYQCLLSSMKMHEVEAAKKLHYRYKPVLMSPMSQQQLSTSVQETRRPYWKNHAESSESTSQVSERPSGPSANISLGREDRQGLAEKVRSAAPKSKISDVSGSGFVEISSKIAQRLKLHYVRTRDIARASRFLYGENTEDIQLYFNYTGGPAEVKRPQFEAAFESTRFCDVLKFVAFPSSVSVIQNDRLANNVSMTRAAGFGRRDMEFFSEWLQGKGVTHIISMQVYDFSPCHSDKSIAAVLQPFNIDNLDWRKIDLDPLTIQKACNEVQSLTLWWSGNNTSLRAWSEPTGLPALPHLKRLRIYLPTEIQAADSMASVESNIAEFKNRLQGSLDSQTGTIKPTDHNAIDDLEETNDHMSSLSAGTETGPSLARTNKDPLLAGERKDPLPVRTSKAPSSTNTSKPRSIRVLFSAIRALSNDPSEPASETQDIAVPSRWLRCVHDFSRSLSEVWDEALKMRRDRLNEADEPIVVAIIDDGVDILDPSIPNQVVNGGTSFSLDAGHRLGPWWVSQRGHGTMIASLISWVCPMAQLYSIRVDPTENKEIDVRSIVRALESATTKAKIIVLGRGIVFPTHNSPEIDRAIQKAHDRGTILLRPLPDPFSFSSVGDSGAWQHFRSIIPIPDERNPVYEHDRALSTLVFPGTKAVVSHLGQNNSSDSVGILGILARVDEDESSVATALAAGLISTLIYCYKMAAYLKALEDGSSANEEAETSLRYVMQSAGMEAVLKNLGDLTEDRVIKLWETLDPLSHVFCDKSRSLEEKVNQLVTVTKHLALGLKGLDCQPGETTTDDNQGCGSSEVDKLHCSQVDET